MFCTWRQKLFSWNEKQGALLQPTPRGRRCDATLPCLLSPLVAEVPVGFEEGVTSSRFPSSPYEGNSFCVQLKQFCRS